MTSSGMLIKPDNQGGQQPAAAVAVIRCVEPVPSILLVRRAQYDGDPWSGHFAFPGGRKERRDLTIFHTCLREVREETAIDLSGAAVRQTLSPSRAGRSQDAAILVQPYVFELSRRPPVVLAAREVESYVWLEMSAFCERANHRVIEVMPGRIRPVYPLEDYYIWGFTYGVLCNLLGLDFDR